MYIWYPTHCFRILNCSIMHFLNNQKRLLTLFICILTHQKVDRFYYIQEHFILPMFNTLWSPRHRIRDSRRRFRCYFQFLALLCDIPERRRLSVFLVHRKAEHTDHLTRANKICQKTLSQSLQEDWKETDFCFATFQFQIHFALSRVWQMPSLLV